MSGRRSATFTRGYRSSWLNGLEQLISAEFRFRVKLELIEAKMRAEEASGGQILFRTEAPSKSARGPTQKELISGRSEGNRQPPAIREPQVLALYNKGLNTRQIADKLDLSVSTTKMYMASLRRKNLIPPYDHSLGR